MPSRLVIFQILILIILVYVIFHLVVISLIDPYQLQSSIDRRHTTSKELKYFHRGDIYDRNGELLVTTRYNYQLDLDKYLIHKKIKAASKDSVVYSKKEALVLEAISRIIADCTHLDKSVIKNKITHKVYSSVFLGDNLLLTEIKDIKTNIHAYFEEHKELGLKSSDATEALIATRISEKRVYPCENLAPRLFGLALPDSSIFSLDESTVRKKQLYHLKGLCGLEKTFDSLLRGEDGWEETIIDAQGNKVLKPSLESRKPVNGKDIYLTINMRYQEILETKLHEGLNKYGAKNAMGVIMDVHTGEILALAGEHENDQNLATDKLRSYSNLPVSYCLEPGSTMKPITALLALEDNLFDPDELIDCTPLVKEYATQTRTIRDHIAFDKLTLRDIIVESSNPGISRVAEKVGKTRLYNRLDEMGLGRETLSKIYGESKGLLRELNKWGEYSLCSISFGQEISLNMLHLAVIYAAFANGGKILRPQILSYATNKDTTRIHQLVPTVYNTISQPVYIKKIQEYLREVVERGTGTNTNLDYINISGKTGTSEIITVDEKGRIETRHNSSFAGYLPSEDPRIVIVIAFDRCIEDKHKYYYASQSAVPTFKEVVQNILVLPESNLMSNSSTANKDIAILPNLVGMKKNQAENLLKKQGLNYQFVNNQKDGIISDQHPPANIRFNKYNTVKLALAHSAQKITDKKLMPDFKGLTLREACALARERNIEITANGLGTVNKQSIAPLTEISLEDKCHLCLN